MKKQQVKKEQLSVQDQIWGQYNPAPRKEVLMYVTEGMTLEDDPNEEKEFGLGEPNRIATIKGDAKYLEECEDMKKNVKIVKRKAPKFGADKNTNK